MPKGEAAPGTSLSAALASIPIGSYLMQNRFSIADLCLGVALEYVNFRYPHDWRGKHPRLALWLAGISTRPAFAETIPPGMERAPQSPH